MQSLAFFSSLLPFLLFGWHITFIAKLSNLQGDFKLSEFLREYEKPSYWDARTCKWLGVSRFVNFYLNLTNNKIRGFLRKQSGRILDIGCGDGDFLDYADVGIDFSKRKLLEAKRKYREKSLVRASASHLPFRDKMFNLSFMVSVMLHIHPNKHEQTRLEAFRTANRFYNMDDFAKKVSVFPTFYQKLRSMHLKPNLFVAFLTLLFAFPIDRIRRIN